MRKGVQISSFAQMLYHVQWVPSGITLLGQCDPSCEPHLARRKVRIVAEMFAKDEWIQHGIIDDTELHRVLISNPAGDTTIINDHRLIRGSVMTFPMHSWKDPEPCVITRRNNYTKRYLYYVQSGEIWDDRECIGSFDKLHAKRIDEQRFAALMDNCNITITRNRLDPQKYLHCETSDFSERFFENRTELWAMRKVREDKARLRKLAEMNKK